MRAMSEQSLYFLALRQAVSRRVQMSLSSCRRRSKAGGLFRVGMGKGSGHKSAIDCGCWPRWEAWSCWRVVWRVGQNGSYSVSCARVRLYPVLSHILSCLLGTYGSVEPLGALWNDLSEENLSYLFIFTRNSAVGVIKCTLHTDLWLTVHTTCPPLSHPGLPASEPG